MKVRILNEDHLYDLLKKNLLEDLSPSEEKTSRYDCYSIEHNIDIELKCRKKHYDELLIEKKKYDALALRAFKYGTSPVYINSTPQGVWAFRLLEIEEPSWEKRGMPKTSEFNQRQFVTKIVGYYNIIIGNDITDLIWKE